MLLPRRVALFGVSRSGKTTVLGEALKQRLGYRPTAFADALKKAAQVVFGFSDHDLYGPSSARETQYTDFEFSGICPNCRVPCADPRRMLHASAPADVQELVFTRYAENGKYWKCSHCEEEYPKFITPRLACRTLGTEWGRGLCQDVWAQGCFSTMSPIRPYVITDGRFLNELEISKKNGALCIGLLRGLEESTTSHGSEAEVRGLIRHSPELFHHVFDNRDTTVAEAADQIVALLRGTAQRGDWDPGIPDGWINAPEMAPYYVAGGD
jgi:hypothetical protein